MSLLHSFCINDHWWRCKERCTETPNRWCAQKHSRSSSSPHSPESPHPARVFQPTLETTCLEFTSIRPYLNCQNPCIFFDWLESRLTTVSIFCLNQPTWFEHPKITPTHPTWFQAPALHKRCHRHLDLLALAQSTFRFNSDSLVVGGWWMSIVKMLKWRKIPDSGSVFHCWPSQLVKDFVHGLYNACLTMVCHNHFCTDWMNWDQIHKKSSVPINLIQV